MTIRSAVVLAAGLGTRMRPITETIPKPLVPVAGRPLIDYGLSALEQAGIGNIVVNVHYLADQLESWLASSGHPTSISDERDKLLDSGGGLVHALPKLGPDPFVVLNADTFWIEDDNAEAKNISRLILNFDPHNMDILLMTARPDQATGFDGAGDFVTDSDGRLDRYREGATPLIYAGALIINPKVLSGDFPAKFSLNRCFDQAIAAGRLFGMPMKGHWLTVGTPQAIPEAEAAITAFKSQLAEQG